MTRTTVNLKNRQLAALLTFLVPGLGQIYQGRVAKGLIFLFGVLGLFLLGLAMGDFSIVYWRWVNPLQNSEKFYVWYLGQLPAGLVALPGLIQATLAHYGRDPILWGYLAEPSQEVLNGLYPRLGRLVEMGTIYTEVAGLLNVLAIFDAYDGPAYAELEARAAESAASAAVTADGPALTQEPIRSEATV